MVILSPVSAALKILYKSVIFLNVYATAKYSGFGLNDKPKFYYSARDTKMQQH